MRRLISLRSRQPCKHWKIALCSLSTGTISAPYFSAASTTSSPAQTSVSLFASAIRFFFSIAASVAGADHAHYSGDDRVSVVRRGRGQKALHAGEHLGVCVGEPRAELTRRILVIKHGKTRTKFPRLLFDEVNALFAVSAATESPSSRATSSVWRPIEPVEPSKAILLVIIGLHRPQPTRPAR